MFGNILVETLAIPVNATLHNLGRCACNDNVRLGEAFGNDTAPADVERALKT